MEVVEWVLVSQQWRLLTTCTSTPNLRYGEIERSEDEERGGVVRERSEEEK